MPGWCLIESDPAVFTELIERFGAEGVAVEEVIELEQEYLRVYGNVYGLILLFKWNARSDRTATDCVVVPDAPVYFAEQTINNACATMALLNILLNHKDEIKLGDVLSDFLSSTEELKPHLRGMRVGECSALREAHNCFAPVELFSLDHKVPDASEAYHFVSFVYRNGAIWELDGLQEGPILCSDATDGNYKDKLMEVVRKRIRECSAADNGGSGRGISFSLMAVIDDPLLLVKGKIDEARKQEAPTHYLEEQLEQLTQQRAREKLENQRRRHNYVPMIVELLKALAEKGKLQGILDDALARRGGKG